MQPDPLADAGVLATLLALAPPKSQKFQQLRREHGIAIPAAFAPFDPDQHAGAVGIVDVEMGDLRDEQPSAIGDPSAALYLMPGAASSNRAASSMLSTSGSWR